MTSLSTAREMQSSSDDEPVDIGAQRPAKNLAWLLVAEIVGKAAGFAFVVIAAHAVTKPEYGTFTFALSIVPLFLLVAAWGIDITTVRELARAPEHASEWVGSGLVLRVGLGGLGLLLSITVGAFFVESREAWLTLAVVGAALLLDELSRFVGVPFRAFEQMRPYAFVVVINRLISVAAAVLVWLMGGGLIALGAAYTAGSLVALAYAWMAMRRAYPHLRIRDARGGPIVRLWRVGTPLAIAALFTTAVFRIDALLLQALRGPVELAQYGVAYRFLESLLFVAWTLSTVVLPRIARAGIGTSSRRTTSRVLALALAFYLPIAVGTPFAAKWIIGLLFGSRYADAATAAAWLGAAGVGYAIAYILRIAVIALGRRAVVLQVSLVMLIINVALNLVVIPRYGFVGAAVTTVVTELFEAFALIVVYTRLNGWPWGRDATVPLVGSVGLGLVLVATSLRGPVSIVVGAFVYAAMVAAAAKIIVPSDFSRAIARARRTR